MQCHSRESQVHCLWCPQRFYQNLTFSIDFKIYFSFYCSFLLWASVKIYLTLRFNKELYFPHIIRWSLFFDHQWKFIWPLLFNKELYFAYIIHWRYWREVIHVIILPFKNIDKGLPSKARGFSDVMVGKKLIANQCFLNAFFSFCSLWRIEIAFSIT